MRKAKWNVLILTSALVLTFLGARAVTAMQPEEQPQNGQAINHEAAPGSNTYRVNYRVDELENGKIINSRSYIMMANTVSLAEVRVGSRVPYSTGKDIQYQDVGMKIDCTISQQEGKLHVHTVLDMTTVARKETTTTGGPQPVFGQMRLQDVTSATIGKPTFVGSIDDVGSSRHYEIEVTVTEAK